MGAWSVAILDSGVTDETEAVYGANAYEYEYYYRNSDTDGSRVDTHGSRVAISVELTNSTLERYDMQIGPNSELWVSGTAVRSALNDLITFNSTGALIGSINMSFGSSSSAFSATYQAQLNALANEGIFAVAASGNSGTARGIESAGYPARLSNVISVGSHDGFGNPSSFSQNSTSTVHILADG